jgi:hypothetical protein
MRRYKAMSRDEQLQAVKEMGKISKPSNWHKSPLIFLPGTVFNYLKNRKVTAKLCATYEAIYDRMAWWDNWNAARGFYSPPEPASLRCKKSGRDIF